MKKKRRLEGIYMYGDMTPQKDLENKKLRILLNFHKHN